MQTRVHAHACTDGRELDSYGLDLERERVMAYIVMAYIVMHGSQGTR